MGFVTQLLERRSIERPAVPLTSQTLIGVLTGAPTAAGRVVSPEGALRVIVVYACVRILAETIASLPFPVYKRLPEGGKVRDFDHPLYEVLHDQANPEMSSFELRECLVGHLCLWGNAYCEIERDGAGRVRALWPLRPDRMSVERVRQPFGRVVAGLTSDARAAAGPLIYKYTVPTGQQVYLRQSSILHLRTFGTDGLIGKSPISLAREAVGLTMATEEFGARFFGNDSRPGGVLQTPNKLSEQARQRLKNDWEALHRGLEHSHRVAVLEEGVTWQSIGIPPEDAQFLETRKFQLAEIARLFRIPPHMIADVERSTSWGTGIEQQSIGFVVYTIRPWLVRIEQAIRQQVFTSVDREQWTAEFVVDGLLRGDIKSRYDAYATARQWGWLSADEIRELENMNPLPDGMGKQYLTPLNMASASEESSQEESQQEEKEA